MLEPDSATRVSEHPAPPKSQFGPDALQILTTEHWSLLATRSLVYTEAMGRSSIFVAALSGSVVALALVAQASDFGSGFVAFALVLLPVVYFLGCVTIVRLAQVNLENARWVQGMNRIRNAYLQLAPELEPYFVTSKYDDDVGVRVSTVAYGGPAPAYQAFVSAPGIVAVMNSVVAGAAAGIAGMALDLGIAWSLALGAVVFIASIAVFVVWAQGRVGGFLSGAEPLFPSPPAGGNG
ncbi:MAG TPA: hypothetical protein VJM06_02655 [Gaiellaceae bacterium]|nr:hypothetical protein [Gaiellaceae bacterium]